MKTLLKATYVATLTFSLIGLAACGKVELTPGKQQKSTKSQQQLAGQNLGDCYSLGGPAGEEPLPPPYTPGQQNPSQNPSQQPSAQPCIPGNQPTQGPVQNPPCTVNCYPPVATTPYPPASTYPPVDTSYNPGACGKGGVYCNNGGPGQWPVSPINGGSYDKGEIAGCFETFRQHGYDVSGVWGLYIREIKQVSVLSNALIEDAGMQRVFVEIKSVSVLGTTHFRLLNPNALYYIKSVSVLDNVFVETCRPDNVLYGTNVNVLSGEHMQVVPCP